MLGIAIGGMSMTGTAAETVLGAMAPMDVEHLRARVQTVLDDVLDRQSAQLAEVSGECVTLADAVRDLLAGGKRLRPAFCYWGWRGAGGPYDEAPVVAAAALELFQAAALVHDDVMDGSDTRRGAPTVHVRFGARHAAAHWSGSSVRYGEAAALLAGDLCLTWSAQLLHEAATAGAGISDHRWRAGLRMYDTMATQLMGGQFLDVLDQASAGSGADAVARARRVIRFKSAKYTVEHPLLLGGLLAGADPLLLDSYSEYALPLGEAFQLRDDVLGVFGDPAQTGKPSGDDLREGKRTVLVALAHEGADPEQERTLTRLVGHADLDDADVAALRRIIVDTQALDRVETLVDDLTAQATAVLAAAPVAEPARSVLSALVGAATRRQA